jgi:hypothetical protein
MLPLFTKVEFDWLVAANGYVLEPGRGTNLRLVPASGLQRRTRPFHKYPGLFKQFAAMPASADAAVKFAEKFGLLQEGDQENDLAIWLQHRSDFAQLIARKSNNAATSSCESYRMAFERINRILRSASPPRFQKRAA